MVFIPEQPIFTQNADGQKCAFNFRRLANDIHAAFLQNGVQNQWIEEQLTISLEEKLRNETIRSAPLSEDEIDSLLISVLTASGFADVANSYAKLHGANPLRRFLTELTPWDDLRLAKAITKGLPMTAAQVNAILPACHEALDQLHIHHVSDSFIVELAIHLAHDGNAMPQHISVTDDHARHIQVASQRRLGFDSSITPQTAKASSPCFQRDAFADELLDAEILRLYPIAPIFPHAQLALSLKKYCLRFTDGWPSELAIAASFQKTARAILNLLAETRHEIAREFPKLADSTSYVTLSDYDAFIGESYGASSKSGRLAFNLAIREMLETYLVKPAAFPIKLSFR